MRNVVTLSFLYMSYDIHAVQVEIEVNGTVVPIHMKLDETGSAFFVEQVSVVCLGALSGANMIGQ